MAHQPSCLQCKQADRDCVSRSRLFVADVFHAFVQTTADVALSPCPSCSGVVCCMGQIWALNFDPSSFSNAAKQTGLGRGRDRTPDGYFPSSLVSASSCFIFCDVNHFASNRTTHHCHKKATCNFTGLWHSELCVCVSSCCHLC